MKKDWLRKGRMYTNWWTDSMGVLEYLHTNLDRLVYQTRAFHEAYYKTNLPRWLLDRISSQTAILKSQTCFWDEDGYFGG